MSDLSGLGLAFALGLLAFCPGGIWLWYFYRQDRFEPEPKLMVLGTFAAGALAVAPAIALEAPLEIFLRHWIPDKGLFYGVNFLFNVALVEEGLKFGLVYGFIYPLRHFDEPIDGVVYAAAVALGFASAENLIYMWRMGWDIIFLRGLLTTLAHVLFACLWGMALGTARLRELRGQSGAQSLIWRGLLLAILAHALYNYLLMIKLEIGLIALVLLLAWMWRGTQRWIAWALEQSPFRPLPLGQLPEDSSN